MKSTLKQTCKLCNEVKPLCKSHSIPNSVFKKVKSNGQAHIIDLQSEPTVKRSQDTWVDFLFCKDCELLISRNYEKPCLEIIRRARKMPGATFLSPFDKYCSTKMVLFILSILWRASLSKHSAYSLIDFGSAVEEQCRNWIKSASTPRDMEASFYIYGLKDLSRAMFDNVSISDMVINPYGTVLGKKNAKFSCVFEGLYICMVMPGLERSYVHEPGRVRCGISLEIPDVDIWSIDGLSKVLRRAGAVVNKNRKLEDEGS